MLQFMYDDDVLIFLRQVKNGSFSEVTHMHLPFLSIVLNALQQLLHKDYPQSYRQILKRLNIRVSMSYGQMTDSLDGLQNNQISILNELFCNASGGGDPSLFVDSPVVQSNCAHFLMCEQTDSD